MLQDHSKAAAATLQIATARVQGVTVMHMSAYDRQCIDHEQRRHAKVLANERHSHHDHFLVDGGAA